MTDQTITVPAPRVPYPGPEDTDATFIRGAAAKIRAGYGPGGSNVTAAVVKLLEDAANALDPDDAVTVVDSGRHSLVEVAAASHVHDDEGRCLKRRHGRPCQHIERRTR